jgi:hypothetical protein
MPPPRNLGLNSIGGRLATATVTAIAHAAGTLLVEDAGQTTIEITPQLLQVRRPLTGTLAAAIIAAAIAPHCGSLSDISTPKLRNHGEPSAVTHPVGIL